MHATDRPEAGAATCPFARMSGQQAASLADALREKTKEAHGRAEKHPVQARLVRGEVTREEYSAWLGQMRHVWRAVDAGVAALAARDPRVASMVRPYHVQAGNMESDLNFLGQSVDRHPPLGATARFVSWLNEAAAGNGVSLVGAWYVLEGSSNGGRFIAKAVSRSLRIAGPEGLRGLDPHGEAQRERWQRWRAELDAQPWSGAEREAIVGAAGRAFDSVYDVMEEMRPGVEVGVLGEAP